MNPERSRLWRPVLALMLLVTMILSVPGPVAQAGAGAEQQEDPECFVHVVRSGENLSRIAARYGTRVAELVRINEINNPSLIHPGDMLRIPAYNSAARDARARRRIPSRTDTTRAAKPATFTELARYGRGIISEISLSPEGERLAVAGSTGVWLYSFPELEDIARFETDFQLRSVVWSPDGGRVAFGGMDDQVRVGDVASGKVLATMTGHGDLVGSVSWSPDGRRIASSGWNGKVQIWGVPDEGTAADDEDDVVSIWDAVGVIEVAESLDVTLEGHRTWVERVVWSPDGTRIASAGGWDNTVRLWDVADGTVFASLEGHQGVVSAVAWSQDGKQVATGSSDGRLRIWNVADGTLLAVLREPPNWIRVVAWSPDGTRLASTGNDGLVRIWDVAGERKTATLSRENKVEIWGMTWSADGASIASAGLDGMVQVQRVRDGQTIARLLTMTGSSGSIHSLAWSPDGRRVISAGLDGRGIIRETGSGAVLVVLEGELAWGDDVIWSPNGTRIASPGGRENPARVWDAASGTTVAVLEGRFAASDIKAWSPDGTRIAVGLGQTIQVRDAVTGRKILATLEGHRDVVRGLAWSPDGKRIASGGRDDSLRIQDAASGAELARARSQPANVTGGVSWSPDGRRVASIEQGGTIMIWDAASGRRQLALTGSAPRTIAWSPDGAYLASGGNQNTVYVWSTASGAIVARLRGHNGWIQSLAWSPDGSHIASGGHDGILHIWGTDLADC